jgi:hypothetical protein
MEQLSLFGDKDSLLKCVVYVDINNLFHRYKKLDFIKLREFISSQYNIVRCIAFNAIDLRNDNQRKFNTYLAANGWKVELSDINEISNIDTMMTTNMILDLYEVKYDVAVILACDNGYSYPCDVMSKKGKSIYVIGSKDNTGNCLLRNADKISYLEDIKGVIVT